MHSSLTSSRILSTAYGEGVQFSKYLTRVSLSFVVCTCVFSVCAVPYVCMYYGHTNDLCIISLVLANIHNGSRCIIDCLFSYWHFGNSIVVTAMRCQKNVTIFYSGFLCLCAQKIVFCLVFLNFWCNLLLLNNFHHVIINLFLIWLFLWFPTHTHIVLLRDWKNLKSTHVVCFMFLSALFFHYLISVLRMFVVQWIHIHVFSCPTKLLWDITHK